MTVLDWLRTGERGSSSEAIVEHLTGINTDGGRYLGNRDIPWDPADLRRCRLLLEAVPSLAEQFSKMATCSPEWAAMVAHWQELCDMMDAECPQWREGEGKASKTYRRMNEIRKGVQ